MARIKLERDESWNDYRDTMPFSEIRQGYKIKVIPGFNGAIFRFRILAKDGNDYSIYFDGTGALGAMSVPYYELYPYREEDSGPEDEYRDETRRYYAHEFNNLLIDIYIMTEGSAKIKEDYPEYFV